MLREGIGVELPSLLVGKCFNSLQETYCWVGLIASVATLSLILQWVPKLHCRPCLPELFPQSSGTSKSQRKCLASKTTRPTKVVLSLEFPAPEYLVESGPVLRASEHNMPFLKRADSHFFYLGSLMFDKEVQL